MKKLDEMSSVISDKSISWNENLIGDTPGHGQKYDFWRTLESCMVKEGCETFIMIGSTGVPNRLSIVHVDVMNIIYQPPLKFSNVEL